MAKNPGSIKNCLNKDESDINNAKSKRDMEGFCYHFPLLVE